MVTMEAVVLCFVSVVRRLHRERFSKVSFILNFHQYLGRRKEKRSIARSTIAILWLWTSGPSNLGSRRITTSMVVPSFLIARFYFCLVPRISTFDPLFLDIVPSNFGSRTSTPLKSVNPLSEASKLSLMFLQAMIMTVVVRAPGGTLSGAP